MYKFSQYFDETHEIVAWLGTLAILIAYFLVSFEILTAQSIWFQILNIFGALGLIYNGAHQKAYPSVVLNAIWVLIGSVSLFFLF